MAKYNKLWWGCAGDDVERMQAALAALGYDLGAAGVDGGFGDCTEAAVTAYQRDHGLAVDGVAGDETLGHLYKDWSAVGRAVDRCLVAIEELPEYQNFVRVLNG